MIYLCLLVIVGVLVYSYVIKPQKEKDGNTAGQSDEETKLNEILNRGKIERKVIYEDVDCKLMLENDYGVLLFRGNHYSFTYDPRQPFATINGNNGFSIIIRQGNDFDACCRGFVNDPDYKVETISGRHLNAEQFARLLCTAIKSGGNDCYIDDIERAAFELEDYRRLRQKQDAKSAHDAEQPAPKVEKFPYPAKNPSGCRFPGEPDITNFQEYGEEPIEMHKDDFIEWWFFCEDPDKPCWSYVGTDKFNHCLLQRRYRHGTPDHYTNEGRYFIIKRNIMASAFALALIQDKMERRNYFEVMERLDKQFPPTGNPEIDGPEILLPPQELLDNPSKEEIEEAAIKKEREELPGKVVYQDNKRKLYFAEDGHTPMFDYGGKTYSLSCHPYEPMLIIKQNGTDVAYVHNAFYPDDEYKGLLKGQLVHTITGMYHNAERFARILSTAVDTCCDSIQDVETMMLEDLVLEKGKDAIEYATYDFRCDRVLYEGVALLLGHFDIYTGTKRKADGEKVYALAFGYPHDGTDMYEYYLITREEYREYMEWEKRQDWQSHEAAYEWHEAHLAGRQVLCNEFSHMKKSYKPFFRLSELP